MMRKCELLNDNFTNRLSEIDNLNLMIILKNENDLNKNWLSNIKN